MTVAWVHLKENMPFFKFKGSAKDLPYINFSINVTDFSRGREQILFHLTFALIEGQLIIFFARQPDLTRIFLGQKPQALNLYTITNQKSLV